MDLTTLNAAQGYANDKQKSTATECTSKGDYYFENGVMKIWNGSAFVTIGADVAAQWGMVGGTLSAQTDLMAVLNAKQATLPLATGAGKVLKSTDTSGGVEWGEGSGYVLPPATTSTLGGVIVGNGLSINASGTLSVPERETETERWYNFTPYCQGNITAEITTKINAAVTTLTNVTVPKIIGNTIKTDSSILPKVVNTASVSSATATIGVDVQALKAEVIAAVRTEIPTTEQITTIATNTATPIASTAVNAVMTDTKSFAKLFSLTPVSSATYDV